MVSDPLNQDRETQDIDAVISDTEGNVCSQDTTDPNEVPHMVLAVKMQHSEATGNGFEHNNFFKSALLEDMAIEDAHSFVLEKMKSSLNLDTNGNVQVVPGYDYAVFVAMIDNQIVEFKPGNIVIFYSDGRSINSVLNITMTDPTRLSSYATTQLCQATPLLLMGQSVMDALGPIPITSTAYVQLIAENTIMVRDSIILPANSYLRCVLAMDEDLSHLQLRSYPAFSKLVEYAVKSYIFNQYIIQMDIAELQGGHNLGRFKEVVDSYSDAEENYQTYLKEVMQKVLFMNDLGESYKRTLKILIGTQR